jgi:hypothetical protein
MSARNPITLARPPLAGRRPLITPTTPVRPIPVTTEGFQLVGDEGRGSVHVEIELRMGMQVMPPGRDLGMKVGKTIHNGHDRISQWTLNSGVHAT